MTEKEKAAAAAIAEQLKRQGLSPRLVLAVLGNIGKESGFQLREENLDYSHTANDRIRGIFRAARGLTDPAVDILKKSPELFAEHMYGSGSEVGKGMGNLEPGDGWKFRGRGYIQVTGRRNYTAASQDLFADHRLVEKPELLNDPETAALVCAWFIRQSVPAMSKRMGIHQPSCSQADMNLLVTSAIAGSPIRRGTGYLGTEVVKKVDSWVEQLQGVVN